MTTTFAFAGHDRFLNRESDLARLEDWWAGGEQNALALYGRRRVGKSWLLREFARGKRALVLVAERRAEAPQLDRFAAQLEPFAGVRPALGSVPALVDALYRVAEEQKLLVVIDEFPYLLPPRARDRDEALSAIQARMELRDASQLKLVLCGSYIGQMERLLHGPLRGRLTPLLVEPLRFAEAQAFVAVDAPAAERIERYAVSGGMSLYLDELARGGSVRDRVCSRVLDSRGPLFNDPREVLEEQLRTPGVYYSLLEELSTGSKSLGDLGAALGRTTPHLQGYLETLRDMRLVERTAPITARAHERAFRYRLADDFMRFWFRFVFPFQEELRTGLAPSTLYDDEIAPRLADHVSPTFESLCRQWVLAIGHATSVGSWWGIALNDLRRGGVRTSEEIDVVGRRRGLVSVVGECRWTRKQMGLDVLGDLESYKIPALRQAGARISSDAVIALFSRSGFATGLVRAAAARDDVLLLGPDEIAAALLSPRRTDTTTA
jgi:AAA+ ATPase superfamily predicted ATPase